MTTAASKRSADLYTRYPWSSVLTYNGATLAHYVLGTIGIILGYGGWTGWVVGSLYLAFALVEMYVLMPLRVCRNCVYYRLQNSLCVVGLNLVSRKLAGPGDVKEFQTRAKGVLCPNNLYLAALAIPIIAMIPALIINFSFVVLAILLSVFALLVFRFFVIFTKIACVHCRAKNICPNAKAMGMG